MIEYLNGLEPLLRTFWYIAIPTSLFFAIQTVMTFVGGDADGVDADFDSDVDTDFDAAGDLDFHIFSLRNLINFLLGFSWSGISFWNVIANKTLLIFIALIVGALFVAIFFMVIKQIMKLAEDNSFHIKETVGKTAEVYLSIPENMSGNGQVLISVKGSTHQLIAMTEGEKIKTGALARVDRIENENILIVSKI
jgi:hypothetical protein